MAELLLGDGKGAEGASAIVSQRFPAPICLAVHGLCAAGAEALLTDIGCLIVTTGSILHASNVVALGPLLGMTPVDQLAVLDAKRLRKTPK